MNPDLSLAYDEPYHDIHGDSAAWDREDVPRGDFFRVVKPPEAEE